MKKVVLVVDHRDRDLRGVVLVAFWLNCKYGIVPYITSTKNEISCLIKHKPDLILLQHVRHHHQQEFLEFARAQGTAVAVSLAEGFPFSKENIMFSVGRDEYVSFINLFLTWGDAFNEYIKLHPLTRDAAVASVGSPRFDFSTSRFSALGMSKKEVYRMLGLHGDRPLVFWFSSSAYANPEPNYDEFIARMKDPETSDSRIAPIIEPLTRDHQRVFDVMSDYFRRLATEFPDVDFLVKPHPSESNKPYEEAFGAYSNIKVIWDTSIPLADLLRYTNIQLNWRCSTSAEAWLTDLNQAVVSLEPDGLELDFVRYLAMGNDIVHDYPAFRERVAYYLEGGTVSEDLIEKRKEFIRDYLYDNDGYSAERCADEIFEHTEGRNRPKWSYFNYKILFKYLHRYRFRKGWNNLNRTEDHPKYFPKESIHKQMEDLSKFFGKEVQYVVDI